METVETYKHLGVVFDSKPNWYKNINLVQKKVNLRLYCLRTLRSFEFLSDMLVTFSDAVISGLIVFGSICWGGNISEFYRRRMKKIVKNAGHVVGKSLDNFRSLYEKRLLKKQQKNYCQYQFFHDVLAAR